MRERAGDLHVVMDDAGPDWDSYRAKIQRARKQLYESITHRLKQVATS